MSRNTIRTRVISEFKCHQQTVIRVLRDAPGQVYFAFDRWRATNRVNVYSLTYFFRDASTDQPCKIILGLPEVAGRYFGENIGKAIIKVVDAYNIRNKVGYFPLDNAGNIDSAIDYIGYQLGFDRSRQRGSCFGHILNLAAKALLNPLLNDSDDITTYLEEGQEITASHYEQWRKEGPVGKLRILVVAVDQSDRLNELFLACQKNEYANSDNPADRSRKPLQLVKDNQTRWLGIYYMIKRAIKLRPYLEHTRVTYQQAWERENMLAGGIGIRPSAQRPVF